MPKIAIVTGSSSGLGQAIAIRLAQEGYTITCSDLNERSNPPTSFSTVDAIKEKHGTDRAIFHKTDVSDSESVQALIAATVARFGRLDVMVNNAGISLESTHLRGPKLAADTADDTFDKTMAVNLGGVFLGCKYAIRQFLTQELLLGHRGWIVNTASVYGLKPEVGHGKSPIWVVPKQITPNSLRSYSFFMYSFADVIWPLVSYCTAKAGVVHMTKCLAREYGPSKIHINAICPGCKSPPPLSCIVVFSVIAYIVLVPTLTLG